MRFNIRYWLRLYRRWQYVRTPRPAFIPTVTPVERHWSATDEKLERDLYLANPHAVWLRPDRNEHKVPCWQIEGFWEAPLVQHSGSGYIGQYAGIGSSWLYQQMAAGMHGSGSMARQLAMQAQYAAMQNDIQSQSLGAYRPNHSNQNSLGGLGLGLSLGSRGSGGPPDR